MVLAKNRYSKEFVHNLGTMGKECRFPCNMVTIKGRMEISIQ